MSISKRDLKFNLSLVSLYPCSSLSLSVSVPLLLSLPTTEVFYIVKLCPSVRVFKKFQEESGAGP